jgi:beta-N-acetylhexosaminidase
MPSTIPSRSPRRSAVPLLGGLVAGMLAGLLVAPVPAAGAPAGTSVPGAATTSVPAPVTSELTGLALGAGRLPNCAAVVAAMPARARLAQRLMVGVQGDDPAGTAATVRDTQVGGIFIGGNATALLQNQALRGVQAMARIPLVVAVDDEGGRVQRIDALDGNLPSARTMARTMTPPQVRDVARARAKKLLARGITMNMAPDVDVSEQHADDVIGDRSFSADPDVVIQYATAYAQGQREAGIVTVLKHFPGHGHAGGDSHRGRVTTPPLAQLKAVDLKPYAALLGPAGPLADTSRTAVMVGHLDVPGLTTEGPLAGPSISTEGPLASPSISTEGPLAGSGISTDLPSSLTPAVYRLLRGEYGFDGMVVTDDLGGMRAITGTFALPQAVEKALSAGAEMALWSTGGRVTPVLDGLEQALASGRLDGALNATAVERILAAKGACSR